jgi:short subunit dehydrogenase-like uncharacterized protein
MARDLDLIVWGATGFTGQIVSRYLCSQYGAAGSVRWAIAGRNQGKLEGLRNALASIDPDASKLEILLADSHDSASLAVLAQRCQVVLTTVGPYAQYGARLVAACVDNGADYVDLTGETPFVHRMIAQHHESATKNGRRIVHCCGFDSIPSDMGVWFLQQQAKERFGSPLSDVCLYVERTKGSFSGGTIASMMGIMDSASDKSIRKILFDPYALNPEGAERGKDGRDQNAARYDAQRKIWTAPFVMAAINTRVVRRSNALLNFSYGTNFRYHETMATGKGVAGWTRAQTLALGTAGFMALAAAKPTRALMFKTFLPSPGEGPSPQEQEEGHFRMTLIGRGKGNELRVRVQGKRDPGYGATARMLTQAALCLAQDRDVLPERYGILTPASAMEDALMQRLGAADIAFTVLP